MAYELDEALATKAWYFAVWAELCTLVPARHLARRLARHAEGRTIIIPLASASFQYLCYWDRNELEPLYLAFALRRFGARVILTIEDANAGRRGATEPLTLRFAPHDAWIARAAPEVPSKHGKGSPAFVFAGIKYYEAILAAHPEAINFATSYADYRNPCNADLDSDAARPGVAEVKISASSSAVTRERQSVYSIDAQSLNLADWAVSLLSKSTRAAFDDAERQLSAHYVSLAHVCDHMFYVSAIIAHATRKRGGQVVIWPHSSMACHQFMYAEGEAESIICMTRASARAWSKQLPRTPILIQSAPSLVPDRGRRSTTPSAPLAIVVFGSAYALGRMPILDRHRHEDAYRKLFHGLNGLGPGVRVFFKPKGHWEPTTWLRGVLGPDIAFEETTDAPYALEFPNLIFMTVSLASTALLEGMSRGIPCMIVRDFPVEDYMFVDPRYCPTERAEAIVDRVAGCCDLKVLDSLADQQIEWYRQETHFGELALPSSSAASREQN